MKTDIKIIGGYALILVLMLIAVLTAFYSINTMLIAAVTVMAIIAGLAISLLVTRSVTRQIRAREAEGEEAEEQYRSMSFYTRSLIEANPDPLLAIGNDGRVNDVNNATEMVTGIDATRLNGSEFTELFTEPEKAREGYQRVLSDGSIKDYPLAVRHSSGKITDVLFNATLYKDDTGEIQGVLASARDITDRKQMEDKLLQQNQKILEAQKTMDAANILASSVSAILTTTTQLASGLEETVAAVNKTVASVDEIKQTAHLSSEKAARVAESAKRVALVTQQGKLAVDKTMEGMTQIRQQSESVAENIVRLSEQSLAIGKIIATVNDLAEQSNLLAVNAAIEAAKAGEHGKGFSVVSQEVKNLSMQSKRATSQVRTILSDIQKATAAAVLAAEQGSNAVEYGNRQSIEAGESIRKLENTIEEAAEAATQIAASSNQQLMGMDQIADAMQDIRQAANQNIEGIKQAEQAVRDLNELGQKLKAMVDMAKE